LDVSKNTALTKFDSRYNQLTSLNFRNGITDALTKFRVTSNPNLYCIETLDPTYATTNWTDIDAGVTFSIICPDVIAYTSIPDITIEEDEVYSVTFISKNDLGVDITFTAESDNDSVSVSLTSSSLTVTPNPNWSGVANIKVSATAGGSTLSKTFKLTVTPVDDIATVQDVTIDEDKTAEVTLSSTFSGTTTFTAVSDTNAVTVSISSSTLTLTPKANWYGVASIKAYASDGSSKDSTLFKLTVTPVDDIATVQDVTIDEDKTAEVVLTSTFAGTTTFTAVSDTNAVSISVSSATLTLTPNANWNGEAQITAYTSMDDGSAKDSTVFKLTVTPVQDAPTAFEWVSGALDTINITQSNLAETYTLQWDASTDVDGETINYFLYAQIGVYPAEEIYDTTSTSVPITYQEILEGVFEGSPVNGATVRFNVKASDSIDTVDISGDNRLIYVNRYDNYLSTESEKIPTEFALHENYPNPFNPSTTLRFDLPEVSNVILTIYNMLGQKVKTFNMQSTPAGYHALKWNATNDYGDPVGAGVYLYQLQSKDFVKTRKMVLLK